MDPIRRLPPEVANRIAAGEVVERPASLVKELVENSLDAGAKRIEITFDGGGIDRIRVSDDGRGIPADQVRLAFERHATSKVWDPADLSAIRTLGFRGEALASIAAVSRVELVTAPADGSQGTRIRLEAGEIIREEQGARAVGTTIEVMALFFNTPARRKFLRTPATEGRVLTRTVGQLALGAPGVGFRVVRDGRTVLDLAPADDFRKRLAALYGEDTVRRMVEVRGGRDGVEVRGLVAAADFSRTRGTHQILLANGRSIVDASLAHAVGAGIGGAAPGGRYPIFALGLTIDPMEVDVNVHPTKREVRFTERNRIYSVIRDTVASAVLDTRFDELGREGVLPWRKPSAPGAAAPVRPGEGAPGRPSGGGAGGMQLPFGAGPGGRGAGDGGVETGGAGLAGIGPGEMGAGSRSADGPDSSGSSGSSPLTTRSLRLVGEIWGSYLLVEDADRLLVIDQHAAHERVLYDEVREAAIAGKDIPVQGLLVPLTIQLAPGQDPDEAAQVLTDMRFDARPAGPSSLIVDGVPGHLSRWGGGEFLRDLFSSAELARASAEKMRDALAKSYSCKGAVKFNQRLHADEIQALLRALEKTDVPRLCPHGRPIYLELTRDSLNDRFERT